MYFHFNTFNLILEKDELLLRLWTILINVKPLIIMVPIKDKRKNGWIAVLTFISLQLDSTLGNLQSQTCDRTAG